MKLLVENFGSQGLEPIIEESGSKRVYKIKGVFAQANIKNKNGRIYPKNIMETEIKSYNQNKIATKRAMGEMDHPTTVHVNLDRVSHIVESLEMIGDNVYGVAKILDTPMGKIAKSLIDEGVQFGVSTRGIGSVNDSMVVTYSLRAIDLVSDPSAPSAYVNAILENKEYIIDGDDIIEVAVNDMKKKLDKNGSKQILEALNEFISKIGK